MDFASAKPKTTRTYTNGRGYGRPASGVLLVGYLLVGHVLAGHRRRDRVFIVVRADQDRVGLDRDSWRVRRANPVHGRDRGGGGLHQRPRRLGRADGAAGAVPVTG